MAGCASVHEYRAAALGALGAGDRVLVLREGSGIRQIVGREMGKTTAEAVTMDWPVRSLIVGIVDVVDVDAAALVGAR